MDWLDELWHLKTRSVRFEFPMEFTFKFPMARISVQTGETDVT
jgi:hypothetical protein